MATPAAFCLSVSPDVLKHPPPSPPKYLKHQVYDAPDVFARVDEHAIHVSYNEYPTFRDLMWNLVFRYKLSELERARVIFRWMTTKNMQKMTFQEVPAGSPEEILLMFKQNKTSFAKIYEIMCTYAELHCVTVSGYAKGVDYFPGDRFQGLPPNHSWNVIYIQDSWQLVDAHWATRYLSSGKNLQENVVYEYDDFYFMMEPQQAVYSHFPEDCRWQLLSKPLTLAQFESLPLTKSQFFKCAMDFRQEHFGVVYTTVGCLRMTFGFWKPGCFTYKLQHLLGSANDPKPESLPARPTDLVETLPNTNVELKSFVLQESTVDSLNYYFRLPSRGVFYLTIYAQDLTNETMARNGTFRAACEYKLICDKGAIKCEPYPSCDDMNWGPAWVHEKHYGLQLDQPVGVLSLPAGKLLPNGQIEPGFLELGCTKNRPEVQLYCKLKRNGYTDSELERYHRLIVSDHKAVFELTLPEPGEYGFEIYANEPEDGKAFTHICQYLVHYEAPPGWTPPDTGRGYSLPVSPRSGASSINSLEERDGDSRVLLRDMHNYGSEAPSIGQLPRPYARSQYAGAQSPGGYLEASNRMNDQPNSFIAGHNNGLSYAPTEFSDSSYAEADIGGIKRGLANIHLQGPQEAYLSLSPQPERPRGGPSVDQRADSPTSSHSHEQMRRSQPYMLALSRGLLPVLGANGRYRERSGSGSSSLAEFWLQSKASRSDSPRLGSNGQAYRGNPSDRLSPSTSGDGSRQGAGVRRVSGQSNSGLPYERQQYDRIDATSQPNSYTSSPPVYLPGESTANWTAGPLQREPPKEFRPQMLDPEPANRKPTPNAYPAELDRNSAILQGEDSFKAFRRVDEHAMLVSQQQQDNFTQLIWQLIYARNITSELERVRAIFLWLCTKDLHKMNFDNVKPDSPEEILMGIRTGKSTYAQIFLTLCRYANLHCKLILGYAKGADYSPGMRFTGSVGQHSWNAVLIDGIWRLVDCHWAARRLIVKRASVENIRYVLDTFYFLANPSQLIYTHFPHDTDWQLLHHPITLEEFESLALVKSAFFKYNLSLLTYRNAVVVFTDPEIRIVVGFPPGSENILSFTIGLTFDDQDFTEHYNSVPLTRYARQEVLEKESCVAFYIRPPRPGAYKLLIYAKHKQGEAAIASDPPESTENLYGAVCEYRLMARVSHNVCLPPFPPCQTGNYGQTEMVRRFNIRAVCREPAVRAIQGAVELRFASVDPNRPLPRLMGQLKCTLLSAEALEHCILQRTLSSTESVLLIFLPDAGEYGLEVYANDPERDGSSYFAIWQYLLTSDRASLVRGLPSLPPSYLGPGPKFAELGLSTVSHSDPFIRADTGELCVHLAFQQNLPLKLMAQLIFATNDASEDCSHMILQQTRTNQVYFLLRFPRTGFFKLQLYALPENDRNDSLPGVYNYLIEASECHRLRGQVMPFPQQFAHWRRGCYLETPTEGILGLEANGRLSSQPPESLPFSVSIPNAFAVAVVVGDEWTQLDPKGDRWEGSVSMKAHWGIERKLAVCASYAANDVNYSTLLEYSLAL